MNKTYNKTYKKQPTKRQRVLKQEKQIAIIAILVAFIAVANIIGAINYVKLYKIKTITPNIVLYEEKDTLSMRDYVLNEVEKAGIDKYKVYNLIQCESGWNDQAWQVNYHARTDSYSIDFGLWEINSFYHDEVSPECNFNYKCQTKEAIRIIQQRGFGEWTCGS